MKIQLHNQDELFSFMSNMLLEHMCPDGAIFAISYDDKMYTAYMDLPETEEELEDLLESDELDEDELDEDLIKVVSINEINMDFFAAMDADLRFCCYGLIIETSPGHWKIIED